MDDSDWDRIADDYTSEILSPLTDCENNPLFADINVLGRYCNAIDLGCGVGNLLPLLAKHFSNVVGVDFSEEMVHASAKKTRKLTNVCVEQADMTCLKQYYRCFDVAFSINSILASDISQVKRMLSEIQKTLVPGGKLVCVLPAMEIYLHQAQLIVDREIENGKTLRKAREEARKHITRTEHDFILGTITFDGDTQKCFYSFEIPRLFKEAGFSNIRLDKVTYSWEEFARAGQAYFPGVQLPWDWYVKCDRT